jgi:predicted butyrate kinase (DUF1464 family)
MFVKGGAKMIFGFDETMNRQKEKEKVRSLDCKVYVEVKALTTAEGEIQPMSLIWEGREYIISKILQKIPAKNLKNQLSGYRYKVRIGKKELYLFYDIQKWYIMK